jgi:DNA-binding MarR family transcriptional regulator
VTSDKQSAQETARLLNSGAIHLLRGLRRVDRLTSLSPARLSALSVLVFGGPCTLGRLAAIEDVAGPTMTRIVDGLVDLGLAVRSPHPDSARSVRIEATGRGSELMREAAERRVTAIVQAFELLPQREQARLASAAPALLQLGEVVRR